ncbi:MAG: precorrin-6y C5,15-methyltransferase (decarboxylating) subunit CbiE [Desulfotomaculales bacterium]
MERIAVIGVGPGGEDYLLPAARKAAARADVLVGGKRALALFKELGKEEVVVDSRLERIAAYLKENRNKKIAVLVSGDPGFYSLLEYLRRHFSREEIEVVPGVSSVQLAFARAGLAWQGATFFSLHGRDRERLMAEEVLPALKTKNRVALLTDARFPPQRIALSLLENGLGGKKMLVGENLSYPGERFVAGSPAEVAASREEFSNCVVLVVDDY